MRERVFGGPLMPCLSGRVSSAVTPAQLPSICLRCAAGSLKPGIATTRALGKCVGGSLGWKENSKARWARRQTPLCAFSQELTVGGAGEEFRGDPKR